MRGWDGSSLNRQLNHISFYKMTHIIVVLFSSLKKKTYQVKDIFPNAFCKPDTQNCVAVGKT